MPCCHKYALRDLLIPGKVTLSSVIRFLLRPQLLESHRALTTTCTRFRSHSINPSISIQKNFSQHQQLRRRAARRDFKILRNSFHRHDSRHYSSTRQNTTIKCTFSPFITPFSDVSVRCRSTLSQGLVVVVLILTTTHEIMHHSSERTNENSEGLSGNGISFPPTLLLPPPTRPEAAKTIQILLHRKKSVCQLAEFHLHRVCAVAFFPSSTFRSHFLLGRVFKRNICCVVGGHRRCRRKEGLSHLIGIDPGCRRDQICLKWGLGIE